MNTTDTIINKEASSPPPPIMVDLDGTLLSTDSLFEIFIYNFFKSPIQSIKALIFLLTKGKAEFKYQLFGVGFPNLENLPKNNLFLRYLRQQFSTGRELHLITAADYRVAKKIGEHLGIFSSIHGSLPRMNLKGKNKAKYIRDNLTSEYIYAGDSKSDLHIWKDCKRAILVGKNKSLEKELNRQSVLIEEKFQTQETKNLKLWIKALRIHQWSKNILIFVPLILGHLYTSTDAIINSTWGFFILSFVASGTYILNDLSDLESDRLHPTKQHRPFASTQLSIQSGMLASSFLIFSGFTLALMINSNFALSLLLYTLLTLSYSFRIKRIAFLDVTFLGALYMMRLIMGATLINITLTSWLFSFSFFFFFSLSLVKRHVELMQSKNNINTFQIPGRGYQVQDWPLTLTMGVSASIVSILIIVLYITEDIYSASIYSSPVFLWAIPIIFSVWVQRLWLLAHRGKLNDDPVEFAIKDKHSLSMGTIICFFFILSITI